MNRWRPCRSSPGNSVLGDLKSVAPLINARFHFGWLRINCEDAANKTVMAGFVIEIARYVQRYHRAEILGLDAHPVPAALKTG